MKTAVLREPYDISVVEVPKPEPVARELLVRVRASGICGTDAAIYSGKVRVNYPLIMGHEPAGEVVDVGSGITNFRIGVIPMYGICGTPIDHFEVYGFFHKEITAIGSRALTGRDYEPSLKLVASKAVSLKQFVTKRVPMERVIEGLELLDKSHSKILRVVLTIA